MSQNLFLITSSLITLSALIGGGLIHKGGCVADQDNWKYHLGTSAFLWIFYSIYYGLSLRHISELALYALYNTVMLTALCFYMLNSYSLLGIERVGENKYTTPKNLMILSHISSLVYITWGVSIFLRVNH